MSYGGAAFTLSVNLNISLEEAQKIENAYKELHPGIYSWGNGVLKEAMSTGYIESADGFKLRLPRFTEFTKLKQQYDRIGRDFWDQYKAGKEEYLKLKASKELKKKPTEDYVIKDKKNYMFYVAEKGWISDFFRAKGGYFRLCLNNPIQSRSAHQTKMATVLIYEHIIKNNDMYKVKIINCIHDEILLETPPELAEKYKNLLQQCMIEAANHYLKTVVMKAEAKIADNWYSLK